MYQCLEKGKITFFPVKSERETCPKILTVYSFLKFTILRKEQFF